jgi:hypothetical protein
MLRMQTSDMHAPHATGNRERGERMTRRKRPMIVLLALIVLLPACAPAAATPVASPLNTIPAPALTTATPPQRTADGLTIPRQTAFTDAGGTTHVVGEVHNGTVVSYSAVQVSCAFHDRAGTTLGTAEGSALIDILLPNESAFFRVSLPASPAGITAYSVAASGVETADIPYTDLAFFRDHGVLDENAMTLLGEVLNAGQAAAHQVRIAAALLDEDGQILDVGWTTARRDVLLPDEVSSFSLLIGNITGRPAQYELMAYGQRAPQDVVDRRAQVTLESSVLSRTPGGKHNLVGEVWNRDDANATFVKAIASFYDADDRLIAVEWGYVWADLLAPGARSPFALNLSLPHTEIDHWNVWVDGQVTDQPIEGDLRVENVESLVDERTIATVSGSVRNAGSVPMRAIEVAVTVYDAQDRVLSIGWTGLDEDLASNEMTPFTIEVETGPEASRFALYVQGSAQAS